MSKDHLDNEISISAQLKENGVAAKVRSRTVAAIDRLFGGIIDIPTPSIEGFNMRRRLRNDQRNKLIEAAGEHAVKMISDDPEAAAFAKKIARSNMEKEFRAFENKAEIAQRALEYIAEDKAQEADDVGDEISEDWMNSFESHAEKASSDDLRDLWARVLAKEIRAPNGISLTTLRVVSELDRETAELFEKVVRYCLNSDCIVRATSDNYGVDFELLHLEHLGLVVNPDAGHALRNVIKGKNFRLVLGEYCLVADRESETEITLRIPVALLTRVGKELFSILPKNNDKDVLERYALHLPAEYKKVSLHRLANADVTGKTRIDVNAIKILR